jgi:hypothetical protein
MPRSPEREASPILSRYPAVWLHRAPAPTVPDDAVVHTIRSHPWTVESVVQTGAIPLHQNGGRPFVSASSATVPALDFKGLVRTVIVRGAKPVAV